MKMENISEFQAKYYGDLFEQHGVGVDAVASGKQIYKELRYDQLSLVFLEDTEFSLHDIGFGLGHYYEYLLKYFPEKRISYSGSEITPQFFNYCKEKYPESQFYLRDLAEGPFPQQYDYLIFGGTFYHIIGTNEKDFELFIYRMLENGYKSSKRGIAFNFITDYVEYKYEGLFYGNLAKISDFVVNKLSRFFSINHAIPLYEYTICVYKEEYLTEKYSDKAFTKYFKSNRK